MMVESLMLTFASLHFQAAHAKKYTLLIDTQLPGFCLF